MYSSMLRALGALSLGNQFFLVWVCSFYVRRMSKLETLRDSDSDYFIYQSILNTILHTTLHLNTYKKPYYIKINQNYRLQKNETLHDFI